MNVRGLPAALALLLAFVLAVSPAAGQSITNPSQSTPVTLYFHVDGHQDFIINTQKPDDRYRQSQGLGLGFHSTSCLPNAGPAGGTLSRAAHTWYGFSSPGYVEYDFNEEGKPRIHDERGLSYDVMLDTAGDWVLYWYLETQVTSGEPPDGLDFDPNDLPVPMPQVMVRGTVRTGDDVTLGNEGYNAGQIIAQGTSEPQDLHPASPNHILLENGKHLYEFVVPLAFADLDRIPQDESYNVRVDVMLNVPNCSGDQYIMPDHVRMHTSKEYRPRMDLSILNPISINTITPRVEKDRVIIETTMNSPWGNYDVDEGPGGILVSIQGPTEAKSLQRAAILQKHHQHGAHHEPVQVTYVWPFKRDEATPGEYTIRVEAWNDQRSANAVGTSDITLTKSGGSATCVDSDGNQNTCGESNGGDQNKESPGAGFLAALAVLGAAFVAMRRRQ